jgi:hypothetical protein
VTTIASGGEDPTTAFAFASSSGFEDLVVGNGGDGVLALFEGGADGLSLTSTTTEPDLPSPTALVFSGLGGGAVQFYAATEGREAAALVALSLGGQIAPVTVTALTASPTVAVAQLVPLQESSLALAGTLLITALGSPGGALQPGAREPEAEAAAALSLSSAVPVTVGQGVLVQGLGGGSGGAAGEPPAKPEDSTAEVSAPSTGPSWPRLILGTEEALERFNRQHPELFPAGREERRETGPSRGSDQSPATNPPAVPPGQSTSTGAERRLEAIDCAIELRDSPEEDALEWSREAEQRAAMSWRPRDTATGSLARRTSPNPPDRPGTCLVSAQPFWKPGRATTARNAERRPELSASLALAATVAGAIGADAADRRARKRTFLTASRGWPPPRRGGRDVRAHGG